MKNGQGKCSMCRYSTSLTATSKGNTTNLVRHILSIHGDSDNGKKLQAAVELKKSEKKREKDVGEKEEF